MSNNESSEGSDIKEEKKNGRELNGSANDDSRQKDAEDLQQRLDHEHLEGFEACGWKFDPQLSWDANWMDLCMLVTRNSRLRQGSMGCVLVRPPKSGTVSEVDVKSYHDYIITAANNMPLFKADDSAIHAEIGAIGKASRKGLRTEGATAYITMPPCKRCFAALVAAGVQRIVTRHELPAQQQEIAGLHGISFAAISKDDMAKCHERIQKLVNIQRKRKETAEGDKDEPNDKETKKEKTDNLG